MAMNEVNDTCSRSAEYRGHFFSGDRYSPLLSSISHYVARGQTDRPHPYSCKYSDPSTPSNRHSPTIRDLRLGPSLLRGRGGGLSKEVGGRRANQPFTGMLMAPPSGGWHGRGILENRLGNGRHGGRRG